ncbi:MAG: peroxiredoxin [Myxococcales bacterium]|nr:peroxiredoxin [Myxococcales bacterium]
MPSEVTSAPADPDEPLAPGTMAPDFTATAHDGNRFQLASLRGKSVVLYFYPKDDTPGCTAEAKGFRALKAEYDKVGALVVGVSTDGQQSHQQFAEKYGLPFALLSDTDGRLARSFGVGATLGYVKRVTFVIGPDGKIAATYSDVDVEGHAEQVLEVLRGLTP